MIFACATCGEDFEGLAWKNRKFCSRKCTLARPSRLLPDAERFWSRVQKGGPDECWPWIAGCEGQGYGCFPVDGKNWKAHRYGWALQHGPIPPGKFVLHSCDNPPCVNDNHHFLGTKKMNTQDMIAKDRGGWKRGAEWQKMHSGKSAKGERNRHAKLISADIPIIRSQAASGASLVAIARHFKVVPTTIGAIVRREHWKHLP